MDKTKIMQYHLLTEVVVEVEGHLTTSCGGWVGGWVGEKKTKLMLYSTQLKLKLKLELSLAIWNIYTLCCKDLKRAPLPDIFFCVKNMTKMKYHADVIHSITQT